MCGARPIMKLGLRGRILCATGAAVLCALLVMGAAVWFAVPANERLELLWPLLSIGSLVVVVVLVILAVVLQRWVVRPLARTVRMMDKVRRGEHDLNARLSTRGVDELAILNDGFNGMAQAIAQRDRELQEVRRASEEGGRAKSQFLSLMSHELRTPLNAVMGLAELLHGTRLDARQQRFVALIRQSARALAGVIDDVLAKAARRPDPDHGQRARGDRPGLDERDLHVVGADPGADHRDRQPAVRARERHVLAVPHLVVHALEALGHGEGARGVADQEHAGPELGGAQPEVVDAVADEHHLRGVFSAGHGATIPQNRCRPPLLRGHPPRRAIIRAWLGEWRGRSSGYWSCSPSWEERSCCSRSG